MNNPEKMSQLNSETMGILRLLSVRSMGTRELAHEIFGKWVEALLIICPTCGGAYRKEKSRKFNLKVIERVYGVVFQRPRELKVVHIGKDGKTYRHDILIHEKKPYKKRRKYIGYKYKLDMSNIKEISMKIAPKGELEKKESIVRQKILAQLLAKNIVIKSKSAKYCINYNAITKQILDKLEGYKPEERSTKKVREAWSNRNDIPFKEGLKDAIELVDIQKLNKALKDSKFLKELYKNTIQYPFVNTFEEYTSSLIMILASPYSLRIVASSNEPAVIQLVEYWSRVYTNPNDYAKTILKNTIAKLKSMH